MDEIQILSINDIGHRHLRSTTIAHRQLRSTTIAKRKLLNSPSEIRMKKKKNSPQALESDNENTDNSVKLFPIFCSKPKIICRNGTPSTSNELSKNAQSKSNRGKTKALKSYRAKGVPTELANKEVVVIEPNEIKTDISQSIENRGKAPQVFKEMTKFETSKQKIGESTSSKKRIRIPVAKKVAIINENCASHQEIQTASMHDVIGLKGGKCSSDVLLTILPQKKMKQEKQCTETTDNTDNFLMSFPKFSHCQQFKTHVSKMFVDACNSLIVTDCAIPSWNGMIGLTEIHGDCLYSKESEIHGDCIYSRESEIHEDCLYSTESNVNTVGKKNYCAELNSQFGKFEDVSKFTQTVDGNIITRKAFALDSQKNTHSKLDVQKDIHIESMWTDMYETERYKAMLQDPGPVKLRKWLLAWKSKFNKVKKCDKYYSERDKHDHKSDEWSYSSFDEANTEMINCIIVTGDPGTGKTSLVSCLASDLGYKVLEVNASSSRSGRHISSTLREAFQSYHVEHPTFNCSQEVNENLDSITSKEIGVKQKNVSLSKNIVHCFNSSAKKRKSSSNSANDIRLFFGGREAKGSSNGKNIKPSPVTVVNSNIKKKRLKDSIPSNLSMILFDDVDVVLEEDDGFWNAINTFLKDTKKPVVLTATRNLNSVTAHLSTPYEIINLKNTGDEMAVKILQRSCGQYLKQPSLDWKALSWYNANDIRRCLLELQFLSKKIQVNNCLKQSSINANIQKNEVLSKSNLILYLEILSSSKLQSIILSDKPLSILPVIVELQSSGFDLLHNNLFPLLGKFHNEKSVSQWNHAIYKLKEQKCLINVDSHNYVVKSDGSQKQEVEIANASIITGCASESYKLEHRKNFRNSDNGELFAITQILENFSFSGNIKGKIGAHQLRWLSTEDRIKKWCCGLPTCMDDYFPISEDVTLDIVSTINILSTREALQKLKIPHAMNSNGMNSSSVSRHPLHMTTGLSRSLEEEQKQCVMSALPALRRHNTTAVNIDYVSYLKDICQTEAGRKISSTKRKNRFLHYLDSISMPLESKDLLLREK